MAISYCSIYKCTLTLDGIAFEVSEYTLRIGIGQIPTAECVLVAGSDVIHNKTYRSERVLNMQPGAKAVLSISANYLGSNRNVVLLTGYLQTVAVTGSAGGVGSSANYRIEATIVHKASALSSYNIGSRVFVPRGQVREKFFQTKNFSSLDLTGRLSTKGSATLNTGRHIAEVINKYISWEQQYLPAPKPDLPVIRYNNTILNLKNVTNQDASKLKEYIEAVTKHIIESAQNGGTCFGILQTLCSAFLLNIIPQPDGSLRLEHNLPGYRLTNTNVGFKPNTTLSINTSKMYTSLMPPDAVWVPHQKAMNFTAVNDSSKNAYDPLHRSSGQPHLSYFKYPSTARRTNGLIVEPPQLFKLLLNSNVRAAKRPKTGEKIKRTTTSTTKNDNPESKDTRDYTDLSSRIGKLVARLLYCNVAYAGSHLTVHLPAIYAMFFACFTNRVIYTANLRSIYDFLGKQFACHFNGIGDSYITPQVGFCTQVVNHFSRKSGTFTLALSLDNVRPVSTDRTYSILKSANLLYKS